MGNSKLEDEVDKYLISQQGTIQRPKSNMCRHNNRSKCAHCLDVDPYDESYLHERDIKHMSFHAYIRSVTPAKGQGHKVPYPLENTEVAVKEGCANGHKPWPEGTCQKCRPPPMRLSRQKYRHVDNLNFENEDLVGRFIDFWRKSGNQRIGILLGSYEPYTDVPLGIRTIVKAIYEPPQASTNKMVELEDNYERQQEIVAQICQAIFPLVGMGCRSEGCDFTILHQTSAVEITQNLKEKTDHRLGLFEVGWLFTDLHADPQDRTLLVHTRRHDTYLLTGEEVVTAAHFQNSHPNPSRYSREGTFGSRFVTVVASADENKHINFHAYQVSNQAAALESAGCLVPTLGASELVAVLESDEATRYWVPNVTYMEKDKYGNDITKGPPLPVEYLLVDVPSGVGKDQSCTFNPNPTKHFAVENRDGIGQLQNFQALKDYVAQFEPTQALNFFSDIHLLIFLATNETCHIPMEDLHPLLTAIKERDANAVSAWAEGCTQWHTIQQFMNEHQPSQAEGGSAGPSEAFWACKHCTFQNKASNADCQICGLPKA